MFFDKCESINIDGKVYEISNGAMVDMWNCKENIVEVYNFLDPGMMELNLDKDTMGSWKKDLVKLLKEWDKLYMKHQKGTYKEMNEIHMAAMKPLNQLIEANINFHRLEMMIKAKKEIPKFRYKALEEEYCKFYTGVLDIFKLYGDLRDHYDIK